MFTPRDKLTQISPAEFNQLYLNKPPDVDPLMEYGLRYHRRCEAFDQTVCSGRDKHGIAMPLDNTERRLVSQHAKDVFSSLSYELEYAGLSGSSNRAYRMHDAIAMSRPVFAREWVRQQQEGVRPTSAEVTSYVPEVLKCIDKVANIYPTLQAGLYHEPLDRLAAAINELILQKVAEATTNSPPYHG